METSQNKPGYELHPDCVLVLGASGRGAIYDLGTGNVYSVNQTAAQIIRYERPDDQEYWQQLGKAGLARIRGAGSSQGDTPSLAEAPDPKAGSLEFLWCEITSLCNERCIHCYGSFGQPHDRHDELKLDEWKGVLEQGADLGGRQVQFIGGEPLLVPDLLFPLIVLARRLGFSFVEVFTNGTLLTPQIARYFKDQDVHVALSLYSDQPGIHEAVTQQPGSFEKTSQGLRILKEMSVPTRVAVVGLAQNQDTLEATVDYARQWGASCRGPDMIRPSGRGRDDQLLPRPEIVARYAIRSRPNFHTSRQSFLEARHWNHCWKGRAAITPAGDVLPCIFARNSIAGNVRQESLASIIQKALPPYWRITLDQVEVCQGCEYRYACHNCRPLSEATVGRLLGRNPRCTYDPYRGTWKGEACND